MADDRQHTVETPILTMNLCEEHVAALRQGSTRATRMRVSSAVQPDIR